MLQVLREFQTHYPNFFANKTDKDKALLVAEYMSAFGGVDDRIFLIAAGDVVKECKYFPLINEFEEKIRFAYIKEERRQVNENFRRMWLKQLANCTDEDIERLDVVAEMSDGADGFHPDWRKKREDARKKLGGKLWVEQDLKNQNALEGV